MTPSDEAVPVPDAEILVEAALLREAVDRLALEIHDLHGPDVVLVVVLKGSLIFAADLVRALARRGADDVTVDAMSISAYRPGQLRVRIEKDLDLDVRGRAVVLVEDIVDTGLTVAYLRETLERRAPARLSVCTLFDKRARRILPVPLDHVGFEAPDRFLLGYGLDYRGRYRNLPFVASGDQAALSLDPDRYIRQLYAR